MTTYVAFLRAVNVGGRTVKMAALREHLTDAGYQDVETYIQTGNLRFGTSTRSAERARAKLEEDIEALTGFAVAAVVLPPAELSQIWSVAEHLEHGIQSDELRQYVTFLAAEPPREVAEEVSGWDFPNEHVRVVGRAVHWAIGHRSQAAKTSNARLEKVLGPGTTRDVKVVRSLAQLWGA